MIRTVASLICRDKDPDIISFQPSLWKEEVQRARWRIIQNCFMYNSLIIWLLPPLRTFSIYKREEKSFFRMIPFSSLFLISSFKGWNQQFLGVKLSVSSNETTGFTAWNWEFQAMKQIWEHGDEFYQVDSSWKAGPVLLNNSHSAFCKLPFLNRGSCRIT